MKFISRLIENRPPTFTQFIKYGIVGAVATGAHFVMFVILNETLLPADVGQIGSRRGWNFFWSFSIAFFIANIVGYVLNRHWVFQPGRHPRLVEFGLFYVVAISAYFLGTPLGAYLVSKYPLNEYIVYVIVAIASVLVNFLGRKFFVFQD
jgi:putative flippase GtrA